MACEIYRKHCLLILFYDDFVKYLPFTVNGMIISVIVTGAFLLHLGPHTQLKEYTRRFYEQTEKGFKVKVNKKLRELMFEVIEDDQKLSPEEQEHTKYFMANVEDAFCFGGYFSNSGVLIALPYYFAFEDPSEINLTNYHFGIKSADPAIYNKGYLPRSMLKSDEAKVYSSERIDCYIKLAFTKRASHYSKITRAILNI